MEIGSKVLFIINKYSGTGYRPELEGKIISNCEKRNLECVVEFTQDIGHGTQLAIDSINKDIKMVFAVGGDGTVNEVAKGLIHTSIPMGIIPKGSGNGLARHLRIPLNVDQALKMLDQERVIQIDTFTINSRFSVNVSGIGFDGHIANLFGADGKRGLLNYAKLVIGHYKKFMEFDYELLSDKKSIKRKSFIISFANSSQFGNNAVIAPKASACDGKLEVCVVSKMPLFQALFFIKKLFSNQADQSKFLDISQAKEVQILAAEEVPFHVDGEPAGKARHFMIKIDPLSLWVAVPKTQFAI